MNSKIERVFNLRIFSLIELMVVISIVSLLLTILLPALKTARDKAMEIECKNNLKQLGIGFVMYTSDFDDWYPQAPPTSKISMCWDYQLKDYINYNADGNSATWGPPLFHCPSGVVSSIYTIGSSRGYVMNRYIGENVYENGRVAGVGKPNQMLVNEYWRIDTREEARTIGNKGNYEYLNIYSDNYDRIAYRHHGGRANFLMRSGATQNTLRGVTGYGREPIWAYYNTGAADYYQDGVH